MNNLAKRTRSTDLLCIHAPGLVYLIAKVGGGPPSVSQHEGRWLQHIPLVSHHVKTL